jgi:CO/xanthine dehydrogenase FAD-binding subunit
VRAYLPAYELAAPPALDDVLALLADESGAWQPLAGGTDLMVVFATGTLPRGRYVSIWHLDELRGIEVTDETITLGGLTTYTDIRNHQVLRSEHPMLVEAARVSGALAIQNRGTLAGNIVNASPAADSPPALLAYDAQLELVSTRGRRWVPYRGFHTGYKQMNKRPEELVARIRMPRRPGGAAAVHAYRKVGTRKAQAIAKVGLAALGRLENGVVAHLRLALTSVGPTVFVPERTQAALQGRVLDREAIEQALATFFGEVSPIDDIRSTARYRKKIAQNLLEDFLKALLEAQASPA